VPATSQAFWVERLKKLNVETFPIETRFDDQVLPFSDPDGMRLELVFTTEADARTPAPAADVPAAHAIRGFHSTTLAHASPAATVALLTGVMGYRVAAAAGHRTRYTVGPGGPGSYVDILADPAVPRGLNGAGTVHHIAFRVADDAAHQAAHKLLQAHGAQVSPIIDRAYFKSIYYREPNGVLFEIATDQPGFTIDEPVETLGTVLGLPPHLEPHRAEIEAALPPLA
jgi:glyoxalase family protein